MARWSGARFVGTPNFDKGAMAGVPHGLVFHVTQGAMPGCLSWLQNPRAQASAHFINPKSGEMLQLVDTADKAWAQYRANPYWISIEHEGMSGDLLTDSQIANDAELAKWMHATYAMPIVVTDDPNGQGLAAHCIGGSNWGGHPNCPGEPIKAARALVVARAGGVVANQARPTPAIVTSQITSDIYSVEAFVASLPVISQGATGQYVRIAQGLIVANGRNVAVDGQFGPGTAAALKEWQGAVGIGADGICGPQTWRRLLCI